jgi:DNA-binding NtrC family response regulator
MANILVVDDEPALLHLLRDALVKRGYEVRCPCTGSEAAEALRTELFDAALIDVRRLNAKLRRNARGIGPEALTALMAHDFPGNVRELENIIERAFAMGAQDHITVSDLPALGRRPIVAVTDMASVPKLEKVERELIMKALTVFNDDKDAAAQALGISRRTIYRRLKEYGW